MTFGVKAVAPLLPEFLAKYPEVSIDLHFSDAMVDLIGEGFDAGLRIARLPDSSLIARRLCAMPRYTVASPAYLKRHGRPTHPMHLAQHQCFGYTYLSTPGVWHYTNVERRAGQRPPRGTIARQQWRSADAGVARRASASPTCRTSSSATPSHPARSR